MTRLEFRRYVSNGITYKTTTFLLLLSFVAGAPIENGIAWENKTPEIPDLTRMNSEKLQHGEQTELEPALSAEEQDALLRELSKILNRHRTISQLPEDIALKLDQKISDTHPYLMKSDPDAAKRGVSIPYFLKRQLAMPYFLKRGGVSAPYFLKREGGVLTPHFLKQDAKSSHFPLWENEDFPHVAGAQKYQHANEQGEILNTKRSPVNALDVENYLAAKGAYIRQLAANQDLLDEAGK